MKNLRGTALDNAIFELQQREGLSKEVSDLVFKADVAYLQDREEESAELIAQAYELLK